MNRALRAALRGLLAFAIWGGMDAPVVAACTTAENLSAQIRQHSPDAEIRVIRDPWAGRLQVGISGLAGQQVPPGGQYLLIHVPGTLTA